MLGAQTGKEASGFGNEVVTGDLRRTSFGREMSQTAKGTGRMGRGWVKDCAGWETEGRMQLEPKDKVMRKTVDCFLQDENDSRLHR